MKNICTYQHIILHHHFINTIETYQIYHIGCLHLVIDFVSMTELRL